MIDVLGFCAFHNAIEHTCTDDYGFDGYCLGPP